MHVINSGIRDVKFGENVKVVMPVNLYECELGDDVLSVPLWKYRRDASLASGAEFSPTVSSVRTSF